ncbi:MAG: hypothetical protein ACP5GY_07865 [Vulcanisaeta sp.]
MRLSEALSEVELVNKFLELNLVRNAAGSLPDLEGTTRSLSRRCEG